MYGSFMIVLLVLLATLSLILWCVFASIYNKSGVAEDAKAASCTFSVIATIALVILTTWTICSATYCTSDLIKTTTLEVQDTGAAQIAFNDGSYVDLTNMRMFVGKGYHLQKEVHHNYGYGFDWGNSERFTVMKDEQ